MAAANKVLIVGGGIGGLSAAIALRQAGIAAEVVEIKQEWKVFGVGIIQPSNALRALGQIGVADQCLAAGFEFPGWKLYDNQCNELAAVPNPRAGDYPPSNGIPRGSLHTILSEAALQHGTPVKLGATVQEIRNLPDRVRVTLSDGTSADYDLVVGADGIHSHVRRMIFGDLQPTYTGQAVWRFTTDRPPDVTWGGLFYGKHTKAGLVPLTADSMYLLLVTCEPDNPRMPHDQYPALLRQRLEEYGGIIAEISSRVCRPQDVYYNPLETVMLPAPWYRSRVLMIGDAAHASTPHIGQGGAMAIEDGIVLAEILATSKSVPQALEAFMARRFDRCKLVQEVSLQLGEWEMLEWAGKLPPDADPGGVFGRTLRTLAEPA